MRLEAINGAEDFTIEGVIPSAKMSKSKRRHRGSSRRKIFDVYGVDAARLVRTLRD